MLPPGTRLGRYEIARPLGEGGMGQVYLARDPKLDRSVAIKVLSPLLQRDAAAQARFEREVKAIAALKHANVLAIYDVGRDGEVAYAVTEYLEGESLRSRLVRNRLSPEEISSISTAIMRGLSAAHAQGIVHRDLKPENIFLTSDGDTKILDFGLASMAPQPLSVPTDEAPTQTNLTAEGTIVGTVGYMSPEQIRGGALSTPSDLFSFGCLLFEMVSGGRAFARKTPVETMAAVLNESPEDTIRSAGALGPAWTPLILRCLDKDPVARPDAGEVLQVLTAGTAETAAYLQPTVRSRRRWLRMASLAAGVIALVLLATWALKRTAPAPVDLWRPAIAVLPFASGSDAHPDYLGDGIAEGVIHRLSEIDRIRVLPRSASFRYAQAGGVTEAALEALGADYVLTGTLHDGDAGAVLQVELVDASGLSKVWSGQFESGAAGLMSVEGDIAIAVAGALGIEPETGEASRVVKSAARTEEAYRLYMQGRYYWSTWNPDGFRRAVDLYRQAIDIDPEYALAFTGMADAYGILGAAGLMPAKDVMPRAVAAAKRAIELDDELGEAFVSYAMATLHYDWDWAAAEAAFKHGIELSPEYPEGARLYGVALTMVGEFAEARRWLERAKELDPLSPAIRSSYAWLLICAEESEELERFLRSELMLDPGNIELRSHLSDLLFLSGRADEAVSEFLQVMNAQGADEAELEATRKAFETGGLAAVREMELDHWLLQADGRHVSPVMLAIRAARAGDTVGALDWLEQAYRGREALVWLRYDPDLASLAQEPRYQALLESVGLPWR